MFSFTTQEMVSSLQLSWVDLPAPGCSLNSGSAEAFRGAALAWSLGSKDIYWELSTCLLLSLCEVNLCPSLDKDLCRECSQ